MALTTNEITKLRSLGFDVDHIVKNTSDFRSLRNVLAIDEFKQTEIYKTAKAIYKKHMKELMSEPLVVSICFRCVPNTDTSPSLYKVVIEIDLEKPREFIKEIEGIPIEVTVAGPIIPY